MPVWLAYLLVFTTLVAGFPACATPASDRTTGDGQQEKKDKPSEPFRY